MINKTVGFICEVDNPFNIADLSEKGLGGAETWIINMALKCSENYHVIIFNQNNYSMNYNIGLGIDIYPLEYISTITSYQYFEHLFINRRIDFNIIELFKMYDSCNNIYGVAHDKHFWKGPLYILDNPEFIFTNNDLNNDEYLKNHFRKIFYMSDWHVNVNKDLCKFDDSMYEIIGNGINIPENISYENRDNNILWSSCPERGLDIVINQILPKLIKKIPDIKLYISTYSSAPDIPKDMQEHVEFLGSLSKNDLYKEMQKHKVSFLPLTHWETFCITSIENIANGAIFLSPLKFGLKTIFKYFEPLFLQDGDYNDEQYCDYVVNNIEYVINNYNKCINMQKVMRAYIVDNYSKDNIYNKLHNIIKVYEKDNSYYM